ncbi:MAG TPA: hypothetical protein VIH09_08935 [Flavobacterium sp.]|uniref:hypothetical protein n=1 Tax=Flavobacterium sp. TaxID=239 RepID=UPI002F410C67
MADDERPTRVQFPKDSDAKSIFSGIRRLQDEWAKKYPDRAHRLYPKVFDENGNRIKRDAGASQNPK